MNRIDRVTAILIQLQSRKVVKAQDIAERFNVSLRTIYRDISTLIEAGVPLSGEQGIGYSLMEGYRLPPVMFTREEATAFLTAEKFMEKFTDTSSDASYKSAMYKIRAVLRNTEKDMLEGMEQHIEIMQTHSPFHTDSIGNVLQPILKSIVDKQALYMNYKALGTGNSTERHIEPLGILYSDGYWYLIAYCLLRKDYRNFRADRIAAVRHTDTAFQHRHPLLKTFLEERYRDFDLTRIVIRIDTSIVRYLEQMKHRYGFVSQTETGNETEMIFYSAGLEGFARWYLMYADYATITEPPALKEKVKHLISGISEKI